MKRKALEDSDPPEMLVNKLLRKTNEDDKNNLGCQDMTNLKQIISYSRKQDMPHNIPRNLNELFYQMDDIKNTSRFMTNGQQYIYPFPAFNILFMTSLTNLLFLCDPANEHYLADGTFSYCPNLFLQLYTIMVYRAGHYVPLVHVALPGKSEVIYRQMWRLLEELCLTVCNKVLDIKHLLVDYEKAAINVAHEIFPNAIITGCRFHLSQAWFRWIQQDKELLKHYLDELSEIGKWLRTFFGLSFLPPDMMDDAFLLLQEIKPDAVCDRFSDYILTNYIGDMSAADFPPTLWARAVTNTRDVRTTNGPESFHSSYNSYFNSAHPNIYSVLNALLLMQEKRYLIFHDLGEGLTKRQRNDQLIKDQTVTLWWYEYLTSGQTQEGLGQYLSHLGHRFQ